MNCKPGDLAVIVSGGRADQHLIGRLVRVTTVSCDAPPCWHYEGPPLTTIYGVVVGLADRCLRPIRDPGDDAVDWISKRTPRSVDLREDELTQARRDLQEQAS